MIHIARHVVPMVHPVPQVIRVIRAVPMIVHRVVDVINKELVDSINTLDELQSLVDVNPELYFNNQDGEHGFGGKFLIAQHLLKFTEDVIYDNAGKGLSVYAMLMKPDISEELRYYLRTLWYGVDKVNALYFNPDLWAKNEAHLEKIADAADRLNDYVCGRCGCLGDQYDCINDQCERANLELDFDELIRQDYIQ